MIACNQCKKEIKDKRIMTREITTLGHTDKEFCNTECLLIYYDKPSKPKNEFFEKLPWKKQKTQEPTELAAKEPKTNELGGSEIELGKSLT